MGEGGAPPLRTCGPSGGGLRSGWPTGNRGASGLRPVAGRRLAGLRAGLPHGPAFRGRRVAGDTGRAAKFPEAASRGRRGGGGGGELSFLVWRSNW